MVISDGISEPLTPLIKLIKNSFSKFQNEKKGHIIMTCHMNHGKLCVGYPLLCSEK